LYYPNNLEYRCIYCKSIWLDLKLSILSNNRLFKAVCGNEFRGRQTTSKCQNVLWKTAPNISCNFQISVKQCPLVLCLDTVLTCFNLFVETMMCIYIRSGFFVICRQYCYKHTHTSRRSLIKICRVNWRTWQNRYCKYCINFLFSCL